MERYIKQIVDDVMEMAAKIQFLEAKLAAAESWNAEQLADAQATVQALQRERDEYARMWRDGCNDRGEAHKEIEELTAALDAERAALQKFYYSLNAGVEGGRHQEADEQQDIDRLMALLKTARQEALREAAKVIPTNWLDPLLGCIKKSPCPEIEQLLHGIKAALDRLASEGG